MTEAEDKKPPTIDQGLPVDRQAWPIGVLDEMAKFTQGDAVADPPFFYFADPQRPVWKRTEAYAGYGTAAELIEMPEDGRPRYGLITTQTCDLVEEDPYPAIKPWVQISPVADRSDLNGSTRSLLRQRKGPLYLLHLDALPDGFWVADLRIEMPVEKGWLAGRVPIRALGANQPYGYVGERIAKMRSRPAFAKEFVELIQHPLGEALKALRKDDLTFYNKMDEQVTEVSVELDDHLAPRDARVTLITEDDPDSDVIEWWMSWWDNTRTAAAEQGLTLHPFQARKATEITLSEYRRMTVIPLRACAA